MPAKGTMIPCICEQCGAPFEAYPSAIKRGRGRYCSRLCANFRDTGIPDTKTVVRRCETCGNEFHISSSRIKRGDGRFCSRSCHASSRTDAKNPFFKGGRVVDGNGYIRTLIAPNIYEFEHRLVAERMLGRPLQPDEIVHHCDQNTQNNDPSNLKVMTRAEHSRLHARILVDTHTMQP